jgi:hypothetical protein
MLGVGPDELAIGGDHVGREDVVDREAVLADEEADPAAGRDPADPDRAGVPEPDHEPVRTAGRRQLRRRETRLGPHGPLLDIELDALQRAEVEDDPTVDRSVAGPAVPAAPDRQL